MKSKVYFASIRALSDHESTTSKIRRLFDAAGFASLFAPREKTAVKLHFGELGNDGFISPVYVRQVVEKIRECGGLPFLTDTNTLYLGSRSNAVEHATTAILHGFDYAVTGAPVIIADGLDGKNVARVAIGKKHFERVAIAGDIQAADSMMVLSHFKGHIASGFGGALKNLGMGCAPPEGKRAQHNARPFTIYERCTGCGKCVRVCPMDAIVVIERSSIDRNLCIGCFECMHACPEQAIDIDWETEIPQFMERMAEYAYGAVKDKPGKVAYMNFLIRITPDCDCFPFSDAPIVPDIGLLASDDPVAIDAASFDLVNQQIGFTDSLLSSHHATGEDKFTGVHVHTDGYHQVRYAEKIGMGYRSYELVKI
ncbi:MAG: Ion-translocating oxidoreductase complex subunit B [Methanoregula sp. SKADARSKE-2]|nr:MAG: Ion-translocating oxidoreductase complex subunit B [Methanoregula sp. SKADARSKE-2]